WTSVGGQYKASIDYVVHIAIESGATMVRGPEVRVQTMRTRELYGPAGTMVELHRVGGTVRKADGGPAAGAWVVLPDSGLWTGTDGSGRFRLSKIHPGEHLVVVRTVDGGEAEATVKVPGDRVDLVIDGKPRAGDTTRRRKG